MSLKLLNNTAFRHYLSADLISFFGSGMNLVGVGWFILQYTGSSAALGVYWALAMSSGLIALPISGVVVDRYDRLTIMRWANTGRALIVSLIAVSLWGGWFSMGLLYASVFINGFGWNLYMPASQAFAQEVLDKNELMNGNAMMEVAKQSGLFLAALAAGYIYKWFSFKMILIIDATTFLIANGLLSLIKKPAFVSDDYHSSFFERLRNGWRFLREHPAIFFFGLATFFPMLVMMGTNVVLPGYVEDHLHKGPDIYGILDMACGVGAFLAGICIVRLKKALGDWFVFFGMFVLLIVSSAFMAHTDNVLIAFGVLIVSGLAMIGTRVIGNSILMQLVPKSYMGRCVSVWMLITTGLQIVSLWGTGQIMDQTSSRVGFYYLALISAVPFAIAIFVRPPIVRIMHRLFFESHGEKGPEGQEAVAMLVNEEPIEGV